MVCLLPRCNSLCVHSYSAAVYGDVDPGHPLHSADLEELGGVEQDGDHDAAEDVTPAWRKGKIIHSLN